MMATKAQARMIDKLYQKAEHGGIVWKKSFDDGSFQVSFSKYIVKIALIPRRGQDEPDILITIFDSGGEVVDTFTDIDLTVMEDSGEIFYPKMLRLYEIARRSALGSDAAIDSILSDLDSAGL
jgi:hypothetical protein